MNLNQLFFHIHYCNFRQADNTHGAPLGISRTLNHHELAFLARGRGSFKADKTYELQDGMLLYIRPGVPHTLEIDSAVPVRIMTLHFSYAHVSLDEGRWHVGDEPQALPLPTARALQNYYQIEDGFSRLAKTWLAKLPGYEFTSRTLLQHVLIAIFDNIRKETRNFSVSVKVEKVIQYMHEHIREKIVLADLSDLVQLSPTYLSRMFRETTGYSVIGLFNKIKMDKAKELILEGDRKIKEVAEALGYADEFYFSRLFKKTEGVSPAEFYSKNVHGL